MRWTVAVLILLLLCSVASANAQEQKNELMVTAGVGTFQDIVEGIGNIGVLIATMGFAHTETDMVTPVIGVHYKRNLNNWLSLGGTFNYQQFERKFFVMDEVVGKTDINYYTFMGRCDFTYLRTSIFRMYSGVSAGLCAATESGTGVESDSVYWFAFHLNALGMRLGKQIAAVFELGFGYDGIIAGGVSYDF